MEQGLGPDSAPPPGPIDKSRVLDVRPLRSLAPIFPSPNGMSSPSTPQPSPFVCVPPTGPFPPGIAPLYPFLVPNGSQRSGDQQTPAGFGYAHTIPSPVPLNSFRTPTANGDLGRGRRGNRSQGTEGIVLDDDGYGDSHNQSDQYGSGFGMQGADLDDSGNGKRRKGRPRKRPKFDRTGAPTIEVDIDGMADSFIASFKLNTLDNFKKSDGNRDIVNRILLVYDLFRRRISQLEESKDPSPGGTRRPDLRASNVLFTKGIRTNNTKRIGPVPGVEVGDIFFFRMELCLIGLHAPSMAGIDYLSVKLTLDEEPLAVSIVSSGGYDDEGSDGDVLIYSGQGGIQRRDGLMFDQKLERGNLALEKSLHRGNEVRVIRGIKDLANPTGKIYLYDGIYKIQESWTEKNKSGCNVFKYKLLRVPGQPEAFSMWKSVQQWKEGLATRVGIILPDLTSGAESQPVSLVNDVDDEKGPAYFTYTPSLKYSKPFLTSKSAVSCHCLGGCQPGDPNCHCTQRNGGSLPYNSLGVLLSYNTLVHECGQSCSCPPTCRNRMSQTGLKVRLEVFKTKNRGWGLRSWDPIRAGGFICEYAGEVVDASRLGEFGSESEVNYIFDATRIYEPLGGSDDDPGDAQKIPFPLVINAKNEGNVARFMNHSCSPNVFWRPILRENNDESYYHVGFFAIKHIPPMQELTYHYGLVPPDKADHRKKCLCGSADCKGYFF